MLVSDCGSQVGDTVVKVDLIRRCLFCETRPIPQSDTCLFPGAAEKQHPFHHPFTAKPPHSHS